ncbi:MAG: type I-E CRISPR-associated protein Cse2/CasB [Eubacterium sp.]|nr:type I-E CRISPR-associated protein Cse2/CasB [Eubacterium sp.]
MEGIKAERESVWRVTNQIIEKIEQGEKYGVQKSAVLARLRNSIGKPLSEAEDVWPILFENLPYQFLSKNGYETSEEKAIYTTLQLYAVCMQGSAGSVISNPVYNGSIGMSLRNGRDPEDSKALDRRFGAMITADTFEEMAYHLRQMLKVVKSHTGMIINFPRLASDLLYFQLGNQRKICFRWAQDYYSSGKQDNEQKKDDAQ